PTPSASNSLCLWISRSFKPVLKRSKAKPHSTLRRRGSHLIAPSHKFRLLGWGETLRFHSAGKRKSLSLVRGLYAFKLMVCSFALRGSDPLGSHTQGGTGFWATPIGTDSLQVANVGDLSK